MDRTAWQPLCAAVLAVASLSACQSNALDDEAIAREVRTLGSLSAEGEFVCKELSLGHLKPSFAAVHLDSLAKDAAKSRRKLDKPAPSMLEAEHARVMTLAQQLERALRATAQAQAGPDGQLQREQQALLALKSQFEALEARL
jgi:hypothetical protein